MKALLLFGNEIKKEALIESAVYLKNKLGFEITPLYIKDIARERFVVPTEGVMLAGRAPFVNQGWDEVEKMELDTLKKDFKVYNLDVEIQVEAGFVQEIVKEYMKSHDLLIMGKNGSLSEREIDILKGNYKSILIIGKKPLRDFKNIVIANDDGVKVNKSSYQFIHLFPQISEFTMFSLNYSVEESILAKYLIEQGKKIVQKSFDKNEDMQAEIDKSHVMIMGNLSKSYFFEKIIGKTGIKLLENTEIPIYIG